MSLAKEKLNVFWFRRDLRVDDNCGFDAALSSDLPVLPIFIFDENILSRLEDKTDPRVGFIFASLNLINEKMRQEGSGLQVFHGKPMDIFIHLLEQYDIQYVFTNHDYEPYAKIRDREISQFLTLQGSQLLTFKDQVIFERSEVVKDDGQPYSVFTPYSRKWKSRLQPQHTTSFQSEKKLARLVKKKSRILSLEEIGFRPSSIEIPKPNTSSQLLKSYEQKRNFPAIEGTSRIGLDLRFGTVSIRKTVRLAQQHSETWLNELIWREFFMQILYHYPDTVTQPFKKNFSIQWRQDKNQFDLWKQGQTGFPLVDAGIRQLLATGFMHNRVRMVVASFLCKHLLMDWRLGERFFAAKLLDYDLSANVGNWQWVAGSGSDAAPFFRIFNPQSQAQKFDKSSEYIHRWVPEVDTSKYPKPIIEHEYARRRALEALAASRK